jgi:long-chain acyl-CoA synthetase
VPLRTAIQFFDTAISYRQLDDLSDGFAMWLLGEGVSPGDRVFVSLQNVPQLAISVLGIWKVGAIPVLGNPMYRERELRILFTDCEPIVYICHPAQLSEIRSSAGHSASVAVTDPHAFHSRQDIRNIWREHPSPGEHPDIMEQVRSATCKPPSISPASDDIALVLYTSGTTGTPKGAMLTHRNLIYTARLSSVWFKVDSKSKLLGIAPLFHITGFELHLCLGLVCQATLILFLRFDAQVALQAIREHQATFLIGAATAYIAIMNALDPGDQALQSVSQLYSGGAPVPPALAQSFHQKTGHRILTAYGMTETTAPTHAAPAHAAVPVHAATGAMAIGIPVPNTEARIVDDQGRSCPVGEAGEIWVRGPQVMAGYWRRPDETMKVLVDGWMRTGDVGFMDPDGWFYLIDRKKDLIIASGFKVWPREVEDVLYSHPGVREAAVIGVADPYRGETIKAFISVNASADVTESQLKAYCRERLAAFKCPQDIEILHELPKTASGKIMRHALRTAKEQ